MAERYLGIDFSGGAGPWCPRVSRPTVWIASIVAQGRDLSLEWIAPVQDLPGASGPFERLVELLAAGDYVAAAIDAPFSIPGLHLPPGGQRALAAMVGALAPASDRPFPRGGELVALAEAVAHKASHKPLRACERYWVATFDSKAILGGAAIGPSTTQGFLPTRVELRAVASRPGS